MRGARIIRYGLADHDPTRRAGCPQAGTRQPSLDVGEATDKGSLDQRMVLRHRAALVDELYAAPPSPRVIVFD
jgi:hypothetical protein